MQAAFQEGSLSEAFACQTVVMIPKGVGKDFRVIGLVSEGTVEFHQSYN